MCVFSGESRKGGCGDHVKNKKKVVAHDRQKTFLHEEKQGIIVTNHQETKEIMEERDRERCSRKSGGGTCPKECPSWLRAVPQYFPSSPCAPSGVGLPVSSSKGNWP